MIYPIVLAGGSGTRLWPLSRQKYPKQFLALSGQTTLLQGTVARLDGLDEVARPTVVCHEEHRFLVSEQLREIRQTPHTVILEPAAKNTAPALTLAALALSDRDGLEGEDPVMLAMPADAIMRNVESFHRAVDTGRILAEQGYMVTLGVQPNAPKTGYGYLLKGHPIEIEPGRRDAAPDAAPLELAAFTEKPDAESAKTFLESGDYLWNSGIFMMRASVWLAALARFRSDILDACRNAYLTAQRDGDFVRPGVEAFLSCPSQSIDYAVMEKAAGSRPEASGDADEGRAAFVGCAVVPLAHSGWSDLGAWSALLEEGMVDERGNLLRGDIYTHSTTDSLVFAGDRLLTTVGLKNVIVVETADAVLVADRDRVQDVKEIVDRLKADGRPEFEEHRKVHRPWGSYEVLDKGNGFQVKRLNIKPGAAISLQKHNHRAEHWVVVEGSATVTRGGESLTLSPNESTYVAKGVIHRLENRGETELHIIEVESGEYLGEDDIVRLDDRYDRASAGQSPSTAQDERPAE